MAVLNFLQSIFKISIKPVVGLENDGDRKGSAGSKFLTLTEKCPS